MNDSIQQATKLGPDTDPEGANDGDIQPPKRHIRPSLASGRTGAFPPQLFALQLIKSTLHRREPGHYDWASDCRLVALAAEV